MSKRIHEIAIEAVYVTARARPANGGLRVYYEATHGALLTTSSSLLVSLRS
jgi:hypothetical protein